MKILWLMNILLNRTVKKKTSLHQEHNMRMTIETCQIRASRGEGSDDDHDEDGFFFDNGNAGSRIIQPSYGQQQDDICDGDVSDLDNI